MYQSWVFSDQEKREQMIQSITSLIQDTKATIDELLQILNIHAKIFELTGLDSEKQSLVWKIFKQIESILDSALPETSVLSSIFLAVATVKPLVWTTKRSYPRVIYQAIRALRARSIHFNDIDIQNIIKGFSHLTIDVSHALLTVEVKEIIQKSLQGYLDKTIEKQTITLDTIIEYLILVSDKMPITIPKEDIIPLWHDLMRLNREMTLEPTSLKKIIKLLNQNYVFKNYCLSEYHQFYQSKRDELPLEIQFSSEELFQTSGLSKGYFSARFFKPEQMNLRHQIKFFLLFSDDPKSKFVKQIRDKLLQNPNLIEENLDIISSSLESSAQNELISKIIPSLKDKAYSIFLKPNEKSGKTENSKETMGSPTENHLTDFFKSIIMSIATRQTRMFWEDFFTLEIIQCNKRLITQQDYEAFLKALSNLSTPPTQEQLLFAMSFFRINFNIGNEREVPYISILKEFTANAYISASQLFLFQHFLDFLMVCYEHNKNPQLMWQFLKELYLFDRNIAISSENTRAFLYALQIVAYDIIKSLKKQTDQIDLKNRYLLEKVVAYLLKKKIARDSFILDAFEVLNSGLKNIDLKVDLLSKIQPLVEKNSRYLNMDTEKIKSFETQINLLITELETSINEISIRTPSGARSNEQILAKIKKIIQIQCFPNLPNRDQYSLSFEKLLSSDMLTKEIYLECVNKWPREIFDHGFELYSQIIQQLNQRFRSLMLHNTLLTVEVLSLVSIDIKDKGNLFKLGPVIESVLPNHIESLLQSCDNSAFVLDYLASKSIFNNSLVEKIAAFFFKRGAFFPASKTISILRNLYIFGFSHHHREDLMSLVQNPYFQENMKTHPEVLYQFLTYVPLLMAMPADEIKILELLFQTFGSSSPLFEKGNMPLHLKTILFHEYLRITYPKRGEYSSYIKNSLEDFERLKNEVDKSRIKFRAHVPYAISKILSGLEDPSKIQHGASVNGFVVDIYLPEQNIMIKLLEWLDFHRDGITQRGHAKMECLILRNMARQKIADLILLNVRDLLTIKSSRWKLIHLTKLGIKRRVAETPLPQLNSMESPESKNIPVLDRRNNRKYEKRSLQMDYEKLLKTNLTKTRTSEDQIKDEYLELEEGLEPDVIESRPEQEEDFENALSHDSQLDSNDREDIKGGQKDQKN